MAEIGTTTVECPRCGAEVTVELEGTPLYPPLRLVGATPPKEAIISVGIADYTPLLEHSLGCWPPRRKGTG